MEDCLVADVVLEGFQGAGGGVVVEVGVQPGQDDVMGQGSFCPAEGVLCKLGDLVKFLARCVVAHCMEG